MVKARGLARLGMLAVGLGIGATVASTPGIASADSLDFQIPLRHRDDAGHRNQCSGSSERRLVGGPSRAVLVARLDGCHSCGGVGPAKALESHTTGGKQTVDAASEIA